MREAAAFESVATFQLWQLRERSPSLVEIANSRMGYAMARCPLLLVPLGIAILVLWLVPPLCSTFRPQLRHVFPSPQSPVPQALRAGTRQCWHKNTYLEWEEAWQEARAKVAKRFPDDWRIQLACVYSDLLLCEPWSTKHKWREAIGRFDQLIARFPHEPSLHVARVGAHCLFIKDYRPEGIQLGELPPYHPLGKWRPRFPPKALERAIAAAQDGTRVEPDNAFFDYALADFLLLAYRDAEALDAATAGTRKPRRDAHTRDILQAIDCFVKLEDDNPVKRYSAFGTTPLGHIRGQIRVAEIVTWHGRQAEDRGEHETALELYGRVYRMGQQMIDGAPIIIEATAGLYIQEIGLGRWRLQLNPLPPSSAPRDLQEARWRHLAQQFAEYAKSRNREDLASSALAWAEVHAHVEHWLRSAFVRDQQAVAGPSGLLVRCFRWWTAQVLLLNQAALALLLALITALLARIRRKSDDSQTLPAACVLACWLAGLAATYLAMRSVLPPLGCDRYDYAGRMKSAGMLTLILATPVLLLAMWICIRAILGRRRQGRWLLPSYMPMARVFALMALLALTSHILAFIPLKRAEAQLRQHVDMMIYVGSVEPVKQALLRQRAQQ